MKYFVTGATGFIGGRVARQLRASGHEVITLVRTPSKAQALVALGVKVHVGDITDKESLRIPMTGIDGVFHIAAWYKVGARDKSQAETINVGGTRNVLEMMKELGIPKGVYTSTLTVFSDTREQMVDESYKYAGATFLSEYDRTKWKAHYEVALPMMQAGLPLVIVLPGLVYGPGDTSIVHNGLVNYLRGQLPMLPDGTAYCWGHVDDTAHGHILAMEQGKAGESYIIAGPKYSLVEAFALAEQISGVQAPRLHLAPWMMKAMAATMALIEAVSPLPEPYSAESIRSSAGVSYLGSNEKARRELGYAPRTLEQSLPETLEDEMQQLGMRFQKR
ncbi:MAG TPA: NAD-dependent epimerase/dehydratase family protein [Ktedonobacteraceae bacterium]|jgi:nucleoside-diphosphate-sugar epimerase|nr:NAD-dependent epimerase/dehydratase family protein [Ktedonobacteraceae bacterium]